MKKLVLICFFIFSGSIFADSCGIEPIKPIAPIGCSDMKSICTCDQYGQNCQWSFQCVKD